VKWCKGGDRDDDKDRKGKGRDDDDDRGRGKGRSPVPLQLLGINDFHGQLSRGRFVAGRPVGGAEVLASYLDAFADAAEGETFVVHAGDHVGASPPASALLQDEPAIEFLNIVNRSHRVIGTLGNHEFDEGREELLRLLRGGNHASGPFLESPWRGADYPTVNANVVDAATGRHLLRPFVIRRVKGIPMAFIGAVLEATPTIVTPTGVAGLAFRDEADAINEQVKELKCRGVRAIVILIHEGGVQTSFTGDTPPTPGTVNGPIVDIVKRLDDEVDVVVSGHAHAFTNTLLLNQNGAPILVTQSFSASTAFSDIDLLLDPKTGDVIEKSAAIVTTWADEGPGLVPFPEIAALVKAAEDRVAPLVNEVVGEAAVALTRAENPAGESTLGDFIADAQRQAMGTDFAFMNPGGIRADLDAGPVTWGELFTIQPFGNSLVKMDLTGAQIYALLEQQWAGQPFPRILKTSGFDYTWDAARPVGSRVVEVRRGGSPLGLATVYTVTANSFIAAGGDNFTVFSQGTNRVGGPIDLDALIDTIATLPSPFPAPAGGRITRLN
jgi:5'-nucleotidase